MKAEVIILKVGAIIIGLLSLLIRHTEGWSMIIVMWLVFIYAELRDQTLNK